MTRLRAFSSSLLKWTAITLVTLAVTLVLFVQGQQHLLRYRATHLLADFHSIQLKKSTWADAQHLISRWGAFGHYDGTCTSSECNYSIEVVNPVLVVDQRLAEFMDVHWPQHYSGITFGRIFQALGGRNAGMSVAFLVENGVIERKSVHLFIDAVVDDPRCERNCGVPLLLDATAKDRLRSQRNEPPVYGDDEQLAQHPNFKAGRPGACTICMRAGITFTPYIDPKELRRITSYNMSCFDSIHGCRTLPEVLPAAADWHLYPSMEGGDPIDYHLATKQPCKSPVFALTRDASTALLVEATSSKIAPGNSAVEYPADRDRQTATVRLVRTLKGTYSAQDGVSLNVVPFFGHYDEPLYRAENLELGKRYILFPDEWPTNGPIETPHCGVFEDSPQVEAEIQRGLALNDNVRMKHPITYSPW